MTIPDLPNQGDTDWYEWATVLDAEARTIAAKETPAGAQAKADAAQVLAASDATAKADAVQAAAATDATTKANAAQAAAIQRANHTGAQAISTVTDLQTALDAKLATATASSTYEPIGAQAAAESTAASALSTHAADTTAIHGITDTDLLVGSSDVDSIVVLTQAAYDALTPDARTLYVIEG